MPINFIIEILLQLCSMETLKFLCSMETDKFYTKFYYDYVVWKLEILCWKFYVVWKLLNFMLNFIITM